MLEVMREGTVRLGRVAGIGIAAHWSLLVIVWLISWSLASAQFPDEVAGLSGSTYWIAGILTALLFFAGLLAHELSHALVARREGIEVEDITLWLFGGVSRLRGEAATPTIELRVAIAGPATSFAVAAAFGLLAVALDVTDAHPLTVSVASWMARINAVLAIFNMVPAFPLDGGRVLRATLWRRRGDRVRATAIAAQAGRIFGFTLIGIGLLDFAAGGSIGGVWLVFVGWFLLGASRAESEMTLVRAALEGKRAVDIMTPDPVTAPAALTLAELFEDYVVPSRHSTFPVIAGDGTLCGLVTMNRMKSVPTDAWPTTRVHDVARALDAVPCVHPDANAIDVLAAMSGAPDGRALVVDGRAPVGIVSPSDVTRALELASNDPRGRGSSASVTFGPGDDSMTHSQ
jgi:Zn-dependent protease/CBS domain-containing protein